MFFKKQTGAIEAVLAKGTQSKARKTNLLSGLQNTLNGLVEEEKVLYDVRSEIRGIMANLESENEMIGKELESVSAVRSNIEKLLGGK